MRRIARQCHRESLDTCTRVFYMGRVGLIPADNSRPLTLAPPPPQVAYPVSLERAGSRQSADGRGTCSLHPFDMHSIATGHISHGLRRATFEASGPAASGGALDLFFSSARPQNSPCAFALLAHPSRGEYLSAPCVFPVEPSLSVGFPRPRPGKVPLDSHTLGRGFRWQTSLTTSGDAAIIACIRVYVSVTFLRTKIYQGR
jgi:hypothetical protein